MKELLKTYRETLKAIFEKFGLERGYGEIDVNIDVKWTLNGFEEVRWMEDDGMYCNEICRGEPLYHDNWMLVYVDNGSGERYWQIFDTNLRDDSLEEE